LYKRRDGAADELLDRADGAEPEAGAAVALLGGEADLLGEELRNDLPRERHLPAQHCPPLADGLAEPTLDLGVDDRRRGE
jgi:hypothetical protein